MRIKALGNTATDFASDDYIAIDGTTNGSRKMAKDKLLDIAKENSLSGELKYNLYDINNKIDRTSVNFVSASSNMTYGKAIATNGAIGSVVVLTPYDVSSCACGVFDCNKFDDFIIKATGLNAPRLWCFINEDNEIVSQAPANEDYTTETKVTAPCYGKLIVNFFGNEGAQLNNVIKIPNYAVDIAKNAISKTSVFSEKTFSFVDGYYRIPNIGDTLYPSDYVSYNSSKCSYIKVKAGDILKIKGSSQSSTIRLWAFFDEDFELVSKCRSGITYSSFIEVAAPSDGYFYVNDFGNNLGDFGASILLTIGRTIEEEVATAKYEVIDLTEDLNYPLSITKDTIINGNGYAVDLSETLILSFTDGIAELVYDAPNTGNIYKVFVSHTLPLKNTGSRPYNNVTIWSVDDDLSSCVNLEPKDTREEVEATDNSYTYDGTKFIIHCSANIGKVFKLLPDSGSCVSVNGCRVKINDLKIIGGADNCLVIQRSEYDIRNCEIAFSKIGTACSVQRSNGAFYNCLTHHSNNDGWGINHGYNNQLIGCSACYCDDDGVSHHGDTNRTKFVVDGGEWHHNGKGGIASPVYGSFGEIKNAYIHNNNYGIYSDASNDSPAVPFNIIVNSCVFKSNVTAIRSRDYNFVTINCVFNGNTEKFSLAGTATKTEFNSIVI